MFPHWTFSHPGAPTEGRAERHSADLRVIITIPFESWQLMWIVRSINISNTGILTAFDVTDPTSAQKAMDLDTLLSAEPEVQIQIDSMTDEHYAPSVNARLVRKTKKQWGLEIAFQFLEESDILVDLVAGLEQGAHQRRSH